LSVLLSDDLANHHDAGRDTDADGDLDILAVPEFFVQRRQA
jgi:hypothetical protein